MRCKRALYAAQTRKLPTHHTTSYAATCVTHNYAAHHCVNITAINVNCVAKRANCNSIHESSRAFQQQTPTNPPLSTPLLPRTLQTLRRTPCGDSFYRHWRARRLQPLCRHSSPHRRRRRRRRRVFKYHLSHQCCHQCCGTTIVASPRTHSRRH
jgi:hypothetical protein